MKLFKKKSEMDVYFLIDPILVSEKIKKWIEKNDNLIVYKLFDSTINSHIDLYASPLLINVSKLSEKDINNFLFNTLKEPVVNILVVDSGKDIIRNLKDMMFPRVKEKMTFFRFYDPIFFSKIDQIFCNSKLFNDFYEVYSLVESYENYECELLLRKVV